MDQQETERNEEQTMTTNTPSNMETERRNNLSLSSDYSSQTLSFLNSDVFMDDGSNVLIATPRDMEDAEVVSEAIYANKAVIVMLDDLEKGMDQRILDFLNGVCYVYGIMPRQLKTENKYVIDPMYKRTNQSYR